ncbi:hypothetical protein B566_EDAN006380, partial [Ephemera danica]
MASSVASGSSTDNLAHPTNRGKPKVTRNVATFVKSFYTRRKYIDDEENTIALYYEFQDVSISSTSGSDSDESDASDPDFDSIPDPLQVPPSNWGEHETSSDDSDNDVDLESMLQHISEKK